MARASHVFVMHKESLDRMVKIEFDVVWPSWHEPLMKCVENEKGPIMTFDEHANPKEAWKVQR